MKKNLIVGGGSYEDRQRFIKNAKREFLLRWPTGKVFSLSESIRNSERYKRSVLEKFPFDPHGRKDAKYKPAFPLRDDSYLYWIANHRYVLIVIPEFQKLYDKEPDYFYDVIGHYLAHQQAYPKTVLRLLVTVSENIPFEIARIPKRVEGDWKPSGDDIELVEDYA